MRCDICGRFCVRIHDIPCNPPSGGIALEACDDCCDRLGEVRTAAGKAARLASANAARKATGL